MPAAGMKGVFVEFEFRRNKGLASRLIGWRDYWSHVDCVYPTGLLGARSDDVGGGRGVQLRPFDYEVPLESVRMRLPCSLDQRVQWLKFLSDQLGRPYDWMAIFAFAVSRDWRDEGAWFCSELAARSLEVACILPMLCLTPNKIDPGAFALALSAVGAEVRKPAGKVPAPPPPAASLPKRPRKG